MTKVVEGVTYLNTKEAIAKIGGSKQSFYSNIRPYIRPQHFGSTKTPWYAEAQVVAIATGKPIRKATIPIRGMFEDWTKHARSLGFDAQTENRDVTVEYLPKDVATAFNLPADQLFVRRGRITTVENEPICYWSTWYNLDYVADILPQIKRGEAHDIVEHIRDTYGVIVGSALDRYSTRVTTLDELNLFRLLNDEPVLILQRVARSKGSDEAIVFFSDMVLLGSWFVIEREEKITYWG